MVANVGFRRLLEHLEPRNDLPSQHYFTDTALPALPNKLRDHLLVLLKHVPFGFITDIWSSSVCPLSLLNFTAEWVDSSYNLHHFTEIPPLALGIPRLILNSQTAGEILEVLPN